MTNPASVFTDRKLVFLLATLCCLLWGSAYPAIKNGYLLFQIAPDDIPSKLVFAGYRFLFAGLVLLIVAAASRKRVFALDKLGVGTPEDLAANPASHTGRYLLPLL